MARLRWLVWGVTALYWAGLFVLTHLPASKMPEVKVSDKLEHFVAYGLLAGLVYASLSLRAQPMRGVALVTLAVALGYGVIDELLQEFVGRSCELLDWAADAAGAAVAVGLVSLVQWVRVKTD